MAVSKTDVAKLYIGLFGRLPEGEGLEYWYEQATQNNWDIKQLADNMFYSATQLYPEYTDAQKVVESIYQNILGKTKEDDPDGIAYWVNEIQSGKTTVSKAVADIIYVAETQYPDNPATKTLQNRAKAGVEIAKTFQKADIDGDGKIDALFTEKLSLINDKDFTTDKAVGQAILESWGKDKVLDVMQDLPLALSGAVHWWKEGIWGLEMGKELVAIKEGKMTNYLSDIPNVEYSLSDLYAKYSETEGYYEVYADYPNKIVTMNLNNFQTGSRKDMNGSFKVQSIPPNLDEIVRGNIKVETLDQLQFKTKNLDTEVAVSDMTAIFTSSYVYNVTNLNWDINNPWNFKDTLTVNNITGQVEVKHFDNNGSVIDDDAFNFQMFKEQ